MTGKERINKLREQLAEAIVDEIIETLRQAGISVSDRTANQLHTDIVVSLTI